MQQPWREQKKQLTRARIAAAGVALFTEHGFADVSMGRIAQEAGVAERTVFRYYPDKEELVFAEDGAVAEFLHGRMLQTPATEPAARAVRDCFLDLVGRWQDRHQEGRERQRLIHSSPALRARDRAKLALHEEVVADALVARGTPAMLARLLAGSAVSTTHIATLAWFTQNDPERPPLRQLVDDSFDELATAFGAADQH